eukprot:CAMPEP_0170476450 /NCGR_PEP_ID=MMETSP0123-20130129/17847_1 /TAXON_ID=182087 /ORGANISM="Favella ehrenbergii, Strain Fehren 1" /LENGTH=35 /DNA_ID= /DNA_START= /DNA_END= /DNA_ORIENTATION=
MAADFEQVTEGKSLDIVDRDGMDGVRMQAHDALQA